MRVPAHDLCGRGAGAAGSDSDTTQTPNEHATVLAELVAAVTSGRHCAALVECYFIDPTSDT